MTQTTLLGKSLVDIAIQRIQEHEPEEGYHLAFSGGKDSIVCYHLCKLAGVKFQAHYAVTTIDPPSITKFIREEYPDVIRDYPKYKGKKTNFYSLIITNGLPSRNVRWCCHKMKEINGEKGSTVILGVRRAESLKRSKRDIFISREGKNILNPIVDWKDNDVWDFIKSNNIPYPSIYDNGHKRAGCIMCPLKCRAARIRDYEEYPQHVKAIERAVSLYLKRMDDNGKVSSLYNWGKNPHEIVYYWVHDSPLESAKGACMQIVEEEEYTTKGVE